MPTTTRFAGLPVGRRRFALRVRLAIHVALGVAFWVQLDGAEGAGIIAAMLALQTRGQTFETGSAASLARSSVASCRS